MFSNLIIVTVVWKSIHSRLDTNKIGAKSLSFYYPRLLYCPDQLWAIMVMSQHQVLSFKIIRSCAPCGALCIGCAIKIWFVVYLETPHLQFCKGVRLNLCMHEWNHLTLVCRQVSLTQGFKDKLIPTRLVLVMGIKHKACFSQCSMFHLYIAQ